MCWYNPQSATYKRIADKPITVYKIAYLNERTNKIESYYCSFNYSLNKIYTIEHFCLETLSSNMVPLFCKKYDDSYISIKEGFHSYIEDCFIYIDSTHFDKYMSNSYPKIKRAAICFGKIEIDSYVCLPSTNLCLVKCEIPKDTEYYVNSFGECVSKSIILKSYKKINYRLCRYNSYKELSKIRF